MAVKVTVSGFGCIGYLVSRQTFGARGYDVVAIDGLTDPKMLVHLLRYDTAQGGYAGVYSQGLRTVEAGEDSITIGGKEITVYKELKTVDLPWGEIGVDIVLGCTGFYCSEDKIQAYIEAGAKRVVISAPAGNDLPTIVYSVNKNILTADDKIISAASYTTNCLAPTAKTLDDCAPIQSGTIFAIHAYTGDQAILDGPHRKDGLGRAGADTTNVIPNSAGTAKAIDPVISELNGKLIDSAQRVPVPTGSTTILTAVAKKVGVTKEDIDAVMEVTAYESFGYNRGAIVSSGVIGMRFGSLFDATQTMVAQIADDLYKTQAASWCDSEDSYTNQVVRIIKHFAELG